MQIIVLSALMIFLPLAIMGFVSMWRDYQYDKEKERDNAETA